MLIMELFDPAIPGFADDTADNSRPKWGESRKTKLTLRQIRKLRKMNDVRSFEVKENLKKIQTQYKAPAAEGAGAPSL